MLKKTLEMEVVNPRAAGIDVGGRSHFVAVGQSDREVREFGVCHQGLEDLVHYLKLYNIEAVALEGTGNYWQNLHAILMASGFDVTLCNGKFTKDTQAKKTGVKDCQWVQKLHTLGLLNNSLLPSGGTEILRAYCRQRMALIDRAAACSNKVQKYLKLLNLRLDGVVADICGKTGMKIIRAICQGQGNAQVLAPYRDPRCKGGEVEIAKALKGNNRSDYPFGLSQELVIYGTLQGQITACDQKIITQITRTIDKNDDKKEHVLDKKRRKKVNKNAIKGIDMDKVSYQMFEGTGLLGIEGVGHATVLALMSGLGVEGIRESNSAKQFSSWPRLSPNNKTSRGKVLSPRIPKGGNRTKIALRNAANPIGNLKKDTPLKLFFAKISFRKARAAAISATARKLAVIIWNMVTKSMPYKIEFGLVGNKKQQERLIKRIKKQMKNYNIKQTDLIPI